MDLSTYDWIGRGGRYARNGKLIASACGFCHPGGGPMEYGRDSQGRPDFSRNLIEGEKASWPRYDGDYTSLDTPDGKSLFSLSGVVEADCLICHLPSYDMKERNLQLSRRNYRWAATAGARLGKIEGALFTPLKLAADPSDPEFYHGTWNLEKRPAVRYRWSDQNLFTSEGRLKGSAISKIVSPRNCLQCHDLGERKNTGTVMNPSQDVHLSRGFTCVDCHSLVGNTKSERLAHQIAKGQSSTNTVRDDLDGKDMKTCISCHVEGKYKRGRFGEAPNPYSTHSRIFSGYRFHTYLLDCMACHAPQRSGRALLLLDTSRGYEAAYVADNLGKITWENEYFLSPVKPWSPWMFRSSHYEPGVPKWMIWFANELKGGLCPIPLRYVAAAAKGMKVKKEKPFLTQEEEILLLLNRMRQMGFENPVFIVDDAAHFSSSKKLEIKKVTPEKKYYRVVHGVAEKKALRECRSCHGLEAPFFTRMEIVNLRDFLANDFPVMKEPNSKPQYRLWGMKQIPALQ